MTEWEYKPTVVYNRDEWSKMQQFCVYLFWSGDECMYIGRGKNGIQRALDKHHELYKHNQFSYDRVTIQYCVDKDEMEGLEEWLIHKFDPLINTQHRVTIRKSAGHKTKEHRWAESRYHPDRVEGYK